jgi:adenine-specific DNA-methyltransferase
MLDCIIERTNKYIDDMPKKERKKYGQFFTSKETARFMAGLYTIPENLFKVPILDAGAGSGILSCTLLERLERMAFVQTIELTCYENDDNILGLLRENLHTYQANSKKTFKLILSQIIILQASIWTSIIC